MNLPNQTESSQSETEPNQPTPNQPTPDEPTPNQPTKTRRYLPFLLPLVLGASLIFLRNQPSQIESAPQDISNLATPRATRTPDSSPKPTPIPTIEYSIPTSILVAGEDEKLHKKPFKNTLPEKNGANLPAIYRSWISAVIQAEPAMFPAGTKVKSVQVKGGAEPAIVDFNAAFNAPDFWQGETKTKLAIYAIVNTLAPILAPKGSNVPVQITVEGKRLQTLGEFDLSDPIAPDFSLNASANNVSANNVSANNVAQKQSAEKQP